MRAWFRKDSTPPPSATERALMEQLRRARRVHSDFCVPPDTFFALVSARSGQLPAGREVAADLYLVAGALAHDPAALRKLQALCQRIARSVAPCADLADEVTQRLMTSLVVGARERQPRLVHFGGHGSLAGWLRAMAGGVLVDAQREERRGSRESLADLEALSAGLLGEDPPLLGMRERCRAAFKHAFQDALRLLSPRELTILRLRHVDGVTDSEIAELYRVDRRTVVRWHRTLRERLRADTRAQLQARLGTAEDTTDVFALVMNYLDVSLERVLRGETPTP